MRTTSGLLRLQDLGDVTMQAHLGADARGTRGPLPAGRRVHRASCSAAAPTGVAAVHAVSLRLRRREAHVGTRVLRKALIEALPRRPGAGGHPRGDREEWTASWRSWRPSRGSCAIATITAATSCPTAECCTSSTSRTRGSARTLRPGLAAARFLRGLHRGDRGRTDRLLPGPARPGRPGDAGAGAYQADFRRRFDLMSLQRNLKALGTFGYQTTTRQNPVYIQYMPRTLSHVRLNLQRYPRFGRLGLSRPSSKPCATEDLP